MDLESKFETVGRKEEIRNKIKAELESFKIPEIPEEVLENFVVLEQHSKFNDDTRMILEGVRNVQKLEGSFALNAVERKRLDLATYLHDVGKAGPSTDPDSRLAVVKLFSLNNLDPKQTVNEVLQLNFPQDEVNDMVVSLINVDVHPSMMMREFWDKHAFWTKDVLESAGIFDKETKVVSTSHHLDRGINPYKINIENVEEISNELKFSIFLLMAIDKYQAFFVRNKKTQNNHEESMKSLKAILGQYDNDLMDLIIKTIDQLGATNSLFPETMASLKTLPSEKK